MFIIGLGNAVRKTASQYLCQPTEGNPNRRSGALFCLGVPLDSPYRA